VLQLLGDFLLQVVLDVVGELVWGALKRFTGRPDRSFSVAIAGLLVAGGIVGAVTLAIGPQRFLDPGPIPGLSLIIGPLLAGLVMRLWGEFLRGKRQTTTRIARRPIASALVLACGIAIAASWLAPQLQAQYFVWHLAGAAVVLGFVAAGRREQGSIARAGRVCAIGAALNFLFPMACSAAMGILMPD
jgi:hypothetical protein